MIKGIAIPNDLKSFLIGAAFIITAPIWFPILFIIMVCAGVTLLGEALRDKWDEFK